MGEWRHQDARVAHEDARRIRYRIPLRWEWRIGGGVLIVEALRLLIGDRGLPSLLGGLPGILGEAVRLVVGDGGLSGLLGGMLS